MEGLCNSMAEGKADFLAIRIPPWSASADAASKERSILGIRVIVPGTYQLAAPSVQAPHVFHFH